MRLIITTSDGEVIFKESLEEYDLDKPIAAADLMDEIRTNVKWAKEHGKT